MANILNKNTIDVSVLLTFIFDESKIQYVLNNEIIVLDQICQFCCHLCKVFNVQLYVAE